MNFNHLISLFLTVLKLNFFFCFVLGILEGDSQWWELIQWMNSYYILNWRYLYPSLFLVSFFIFFLHYWLLENTHVVLRIEFFCLFLLGNRNCLLWFLHLYLERTDTLLYWLIVVDVGFRSEKWISLLLFVCLS